MADFIQLKKDNILRICDLFDKYNISYYCFLKNEEDWRI